MTGGGNLVGGTCISRGCLRGIHEPSRFHCQRYARWRPVNEAGRRSHADAVRAEERRELDRQARRRWAAEELGEPRGERWRSGAAAPGSPCAWVTPTRHRARGTALTRYPARGDMSHQLPSEVRRLADEHRLGELEAVHLQRGLRSLLLVIASILVLLAVLVVVSAFLYPGTDSSLPSLEYNQQDLVPPLLLAFFVVLLAVGAMRLRQVMRRRAYVYSEGFVATDEGQGETAVRWDEIDNLWLDVNGVNPHFAVTYLDESGKPRRTYRFRVNTLRNWGFAGPLRRRCVLEMERRGWHRHPVDALRRSGHTVYIWATDEWFKEEPEDDGDSDETSGGP